MQGHSKRTTFITGAASGIGLETARALVARGERVIVSARDEKRCADVRAELGETLETVVMEMTSLASIRAGAARVREIAPVLDVLINNAGVVETKRAIDTDGFETTWAVNVLGPYALSELLVPVLEVAAEPRVVNVGSVAHKSGKIGWDDLQYATRKYGGWSSYAQSKLALMLVTREFARRHPRIEANCVHPGGIATGIWRNLPTILRVVLARLLPSAATGAIPIVYVASEAAVRGVTGAYFDKTTQVAPSAAALNDADAARLYEELARQTAATA